MQSKTKCTIEVWLINLLLITSTYAQDAASLMGSCGFNQGIVDINTFNSIEAHHTLGLRSTRIAVYPTFDSRTGNVIPQVLDNLILLLYEQGIRPMLLVEHYLKHNGPIGSYRKWYKIGWAFANRFSPNSPWLKNKGIKDWGIKYYTAFNEPDNSFETEEYINAIRGFANGVHAVNKGLQVAPGGFMEVPLFTNTNKYMPGLAALYNDGTLDAIDIHRYYDRRNPYQVRSRAMSQQALVDSLKSRHHIHADIRVWSTEYNARGADGIGNAIDFITATWDLLTVTNENGEFISDFALAYVSYMKESDNRHLGMAISKFPYEGNAKGKSHRMMTFLSDGLRLKNKDPDLGIIRLEGKEKKMWVWHNRTEWSSLAGGTIHLDDIPIYARQLEVYRYDSWKMDRGSSGEPTPYKTISLQKNQKSIKIKNLEIGQTYMILAIKKPSIANLPKVDFMNLPREINAGQSLQISVEPENNIPLREVILYAGPERIGSIKKSPFQWTWPNPPAGTTELRAIAKTSLKDVSMSTRSIFVKHTAPQEVIAEADTYLKGGTLYKHNNYGTVAYLPIKTSSNHKLRRMIFLKFDLSATQQVEKAILKIRTATSGEAEHIVYPIENDQWEENKITWVNRPLLGEEWCRFFTVPQGRWTAVDITGFVTSQIQKDGVVSLALWTKDTPLVEYYSKESLKGNEPRIEIISKK
ncbi:MAG: DNRLRE domain-containing protein [Cyclobacteriaceae bacterium]|nr:DNRLRE domain-containing protein [Cyclobacteriaceae bacterium HetDA_MAG_MS6]